MKPVPFVITITFTFNLNFDVVRVLIDYLITILTVKMAIT